ncbi:MAG: RNA-directed DNA polymerase, partial [Myxococcales bacterium]|nr:RNA-directed DNA polymerase [Myxococcales bacterium]
MTDPAATRPLPPWSEIAEAGGVDAWIVAELRARGLWEEGVDTSTLSDRDRKKYKARREEERRVRRELRRHAWAEFRRNNLVHIGAGIFYHDTADVDRFDIKDPDARRQDNALPKLPDTAALAKALGLGMPRLRWLVFHRQVDRGTHYHRWHVPKRDGGLRLISAPKPDLKAAQRWIARNITEHLPVHGAAHGFVPGRSTVTNAQVHAGARVVIKLDLQNFYPTITQPRVKGLLRKAGYGEQVATVLSMLCTESPREVIELRGTPHHVAIGPRSLPQGAPTSPSITNALCLRLDRRMQGLAGTLGFRYSRYADDLTFSWHADGEAPVGKLLHRVRSIVG